jgi:prepilin-type processing-associated H-X9-DG protein
VLQRDHLEPRFPEVAIIPSPFFSGYIIAILAAILFPVFARAREKARQTSCLSNVKQLGLGCLMYAQDYDERTVSGSGYQGTTINWELKVMPYVKNTQIFICPSSPYGAFDYWGSTLYRSYSLPVGAGIAMAQFTKPAETAMLGDGVHPAVEYPRGLVPVVCRGWATCQTTPPGEKDFLHNGGNNMVMYDGHAKWANWMTLKAASDYHYGLSTTDAKLYFKNNP